MSINTVEEALAEASASRKRAAEHRLKLIAALRSQTCACGGRKKSRQSFCVSCYYQIPASTRRGLHCAIGHGYESSYDVALAGLIKRGVISA